MSIMRYIYFLFFVFCGINLYSQNIYFERTGLHTFSDGKVEGKLHDFRYIFESDEDLLFLFDRFDKARKTQRTMNHMSLGFVGSGLLVGTLILQGGDDIGDVLAGFGVFLLGGAFGTIFFITGNLFAGSTKENYKNKLLDRLSPGSAYRYAPSLHLGLSQHGVGFVVSF